MNKLTIHDRVVQLPLEDGVVAQGYMLTQWMPEYEVLRKEKMSLVRKPIRNLPDTQRTVLLLHEYEDLKYQEIAERMKHTESSIKSLLHRARTSVKLQLYHYYSESSVMK